ncbi:MAG TPA: hypothetical protein VGN26_21095, partial [Armatimonadota bacterium]
MLWLSALLCQFSVGAARCHDWVEWTPDSPIIASSISSPSECLPGAEVSCSVQGATDLDQRLDRQTGVTTHPADLLNYTWTATAGSFKNGNTGSTVVWVAPQQGVTAQITCKIDDLALVPAGESGSRDDSYVTLTKSIVAIKVSITSLGFTGDHHLKIWQNGPVVDPGDDTPVWSSGGSSLPVCYTKNTPPTMFGTFSVSPDVNAAQPTVYLRAKVGSTTVGSKSGCRLAGNHLEDSSGTDGVVNGIGGGSAIPDSTRVRKLTPSIAWEYSLDGSSWSSAGATGTIPFYFTLATPIGETPYDLALEKVCGYMQSESDDSALASRTCTGIAGQVLYWPGGN